MSLALSLAVIALFSSTLIITKPKDSTSATVVLWLLRIVTFSLLFRSFLGPTILRLLSSRLRVQSVSLRSIRGIYFRAGKGILHIDRVGLSYHRPHQHSASRFSIRVEGFHLELVNSEFKEKRKSKSAGSNEHGRTKVATRVARKTWSIARRMASALYTAMEPYARPVLRKFVMWAFRIAIRSLPTLTQVLDLDLDSAIITAPSVVPGVEAVVNRARVSARMAFTQLDNSRDGVLDNVPPLARHRRFASVADLNTRIKNSFRRTLGRAWGATRVAVSLTLEIEEIACLATRALLAEVGGYEDSTCCSLIPYCLR